MISDSLMSILLLWPISFTFLPNTSHHSIILTLMTCLKLSLAQAMMPWLMTFVTDSLNMIAIFIYMMTSSSLITFLFTIYLLLMKCGWVSWCTVLIDVTLKKAVALPKITNKSSGFIRPLMNRLTHFQILFSSLIMIEKLQTIHLQSLFQKKERVLHKLIKMMSLNAPEGAPHSIPCLDLDEATVFSCWFSKSWWTWSWTSMQKITNLGIPIWLST